MWTSSASCPAWPSSPASFVSATEPGGGALGEVGAHPVPLCTGHCSQHLDGGEGVVCLTRRQVSVGWVDRVAQVRPRRPPLEPRLLSPSGWRWPPSPRISAPAVERDHPPPPLHLGSALPSPGNGPGAPSCTLSRSLTEWGSRARRGHSHSTEDTAGILIKNRTRLLSCPQEGGLSRNQEEK